MSGRYGVPMNIYGSILPGAARVSRLTLLSKEAHQRLKWFDFYQSHGRNARLTCRHFGLSPDVFYRWKGRYHPHQLGTLEDDRVTRTPRRLRQPETDPVIVARIQELRETYPRWGKKKLWKLLAREGLLTSVSTVGRTLTRLRRAGRLHEPAIVTAAIAARARRRSRGNRPYAIRKPWDYDVTFPGDLVEIDTVHLTPFPGTKWYQFTATDVIAKHTARLVASRITATAAVRLLDAITERFPYPIRAIQIDGGSEFRAEFERACQRRGMQLFELPPQSPKLNGQVERMQRTSREEVYDLQHFLTVTELNARLIEEDRIYNTIRPHDSLDLLTPEEYYQATFAGV